MSSSQQTEETLRLANKAGLVIVTKDSPHTQLLGELILGGRF